MKISEIVCKCYFDGQNAQGSWARMWPLAGSGVLSWLQCDDLVLSNKNIDVMCCFANGCRSLNDTCELTPTQIDIAARNRDSTLAAIAIELRFDVKGVELAESYEKILTLRPHRPGRESISFVSHKVDDLVGLELHRGRTVTIDIAVLRQQGYSKFDLICELGESNWKLFDRDYISTFSVSAKVAL